MKSSRASDWASHRWSSRRGSKQHESADKPPFDLAGVITEIIGFATILYAASIAADQGWTSPTTLTWFAVSAVGLIVFGVVELFVAKAPLLDLRLFGNRVFLNASLLGYVSTIALFGAEFLMPVYLQALRGRTALETGFILLPMALTGGICVTLSGRIYDKAGPRPLMVSGFAILMVNTWQLSQIQANTSIEWIIFLLALRGAGARPDRPDDDGDGAVGRDKTRPGARLVADECHAAGRPVHRRGGARDGISQHDLA